MKLLIFSPTILALVLMLSSLKRWWSYGEISTYTRLLLQSVRWQRYPEAA